MSLEASNIETDSNCCHTEEDIDEIIEERNEGVSDE